MGLASGLSGATPIFLLTKGGATSAARTYSLSGTPFAEADARSDSFHLKERMRRSRIIKLKAARFDEVLTG